MRHLTIIILMTIALPTFGQLTLTTTIGLAETYCTNPGDPDDCFNVPVGNDTLVYQPGIDGDYVVTYKIENNTAVNVVKISISDSRHGLVLPNTAVSITSGGTYFYTERFNSVTAPGFDEITATLLAESSTGSTSSKTDEYVLNVAQPLLETDFSLVRKIDACPEEGIIAPECTSTNYGNFTINVGAGDTIVTRFDWENAGLGTFDQSVLVDQDDVQLASTGFDQIPGQRLISAQFFKAPDLPGTYARSQTVTVTDFAGNTATKTHNYTIVVEAPEVETSFSLVRKIDACPGGQIAPECGTTNYGNFSINVGAGDTIVTRFNWKNIGLGTYDLSTLTDQDDEILANTGFNQVTGQELISAQYIKAPDLQGTYNWSQTVTVTDFGGNVATETINYTVIVEAPQLETSFSLVRKIDACPGGQIAPECTGTNYGNLTINVGAGDTIVTRFNWKNIGLGTYDLSTLTDQDGEILANTGFNQVTGQELISAQYIKAPDLQGTYNWSQTITVTDFGGNIATETINYTVIVEAPQLETSFSLVRKQDACPGVAIAPNCGITNYGNTTITAGSGDTIVTRFNWKNIGLGTFDLSTLTDQDGEVLANTGFNQITGQELISAQFIIAPSLPGTYNWSQTIMVTDFGGNIDTETINYTVVVDCSIDDFAPPIAICKDTTLVVNPGDTVNINILNLAGDSYDECGGALTNGSISQNSFTCADVGENIVTVTFEDQNGNIATCTSIVTVELSGNISLSAGPDQSVCGTSVSLNAKVPAGGVAIGWSIESGLGGKVVDLTDPKSGFSGIQGETYILKWTHENTAGTCQFSDEVVIEMLELPTNANAGTNVNTCLTDTVVLAGNIPTIGIGSWEILSGSNGFLSDTTAHNSIFYGQRGQTYTLEWSIKNGTCNASKDVVNIEFFDFPSTANAGEDQILCDDNTTLSAFPITTGQGEWTIINGSGGSLSDANMNNSNFSGSRGQTYQLEWKVSNGTCSVNRDTVSITFEQLPSEAMAGADQTVANDSTTLAATIPSIGNGSWDIISGLGGSFVDNQSNTSTFIGLQGEVYQLEWSVQSGSCPPSKDTVVISMSALPPTVANAGEDKILCTTSSMLEGNVPTVGSGSWTIVDGIGGSITSPALATSSFSGTAGETYVLQWRTENDGLFSSDQVMIRFASANEVITDNYLNTWNTINEINGDEALTVEATIDATKVLTLNAGTEVTFSPEAVIEEGAQLTINIQTCGE